MNNEVTKWKDYNIYGDHTIHYVFKNELGHYKHVCRILTKKPDVYGNWHKTIIRQYKEYYYIEIKY